MTSNKSRKNPAYNTFDGVINPPARFLPKKVSKQLGKGGKRGKGIIEKIVLGAIAGPAALAVFGPTIVKKLRDSGVSFKGTRRQRAISFKGTRRQRGERKQLGKGGVFVGRRKQTGAGGVFIGTRKQSGQGAVFKGVRKQSGRGAVLKNKSCYIRRRRQ